MKSVSSFSLPSAASCALTMSMSMLWSFQIPFPELFVFCFRLRLEHLPRRRRLVVVFAFWRCELNFLARCWRSIKTETTTKGISSSNNNNNNDNAKWPRTAGGKETARETGFDCSWKRDGDRRSYSFIEPPIRLSIELQRTEGERQRMRWEEGVEGGSFVGGCCKRFPRYPVSRK